MCTHMFAAFRSRILGFSMRSLFLLFFLRLPPTPVCFRCFETRKASKFCLTSNFKHLMIKIALLQPVDVQPATTRNKKAEMSMQVL